MTKTRLRSGGLREPRRPNPSRSTPRSSLLDGAHRGRCLDSSERHDPDSPGQGYPDIFSSETGAQLRDWAQAVSCVAYTTFLVALGSHVCCGSESARVLIGPVTARPKLGHMPRVLAVAARLCPPFGRAQIRRLTRDKRLRTVVHTPRYVSHPSMCPRCAQHLARVYLRAFVGGQAIVRPDELCSTCQVRLQEFARCHRREVA
jgi:hypothetical protein